MRAIENLFLENDNNDVKLKLCASSQNCLLDAAKNNVEFRRAIDNLNSAQKILNVFITLGFSRDYREDLELKYYIKNILWDSADVLSVLGESTYPFSLMFRENVLANLDRFKDFLLGKVEKALKNKAENLNCTYDEFPLVQSILGELEVFNKLFFINIKESQPLLELSTSMDISPSDKLYDDNIIYTADSPIAFDIIRRAQEENTPIKEVVEILNLANLRKRKLEEVEKSHSKTLKRNTFPFFKASPQTEEKPEEATESFSHK